MEPLGSEDPVGARAGRGVVWAWAGGAPAMSVASAWGLARDSNPLAPGVSVVYSK